MALLYVLHGHRCEMGFYVLRDVSLKKARECAT
ncbi:hypothetical protein O9A_00066 [Bartonella koehlerae C-29]|uniref:Uncharacterized protein n=1 Tax=Bartonella koehlerae C-29 TaxID=1134510 RepID=A0A067WKX4_9HYPH|nr:hypothetical protein O9A_00066 [Bartonella koehlerae C-29]